MYKFVISVHPNTSAKMKLSPKIHKFFENLAKFFTFATAGSYKLYLKVTENFFLNCTTE